MEKETLQEAAKEYAEKVGNVTGKGWLYDAVKFGANWQAERMYSEAEVLNILHTYSNHFEILTTPKFSNDMFFDMFFEWFEQFKKK